MYVLVSRSGPSLEEAEDLARFHLTIEPDVDDPATALGQWGIVEGDHAWVQVDALRRAAAGRVGARWDADFTGMLTYAAEKRWLSEDGLAIRAHIQRVTTA